MYTNGMRPVHPGEILKEEFLVPHDMSVTALANAIGVTPARINDVVLRRRGITADTALRLALYFDTTPEFWMNLQSSFELQKARLEGATLNIKPLCVA